ncbi:acetyl-CoA decarbonylase/synthase complex subunit gamma [Geobacter sp. DSM 9736]|nr:acetyl-CoA decarbonylase/synthase complex subunit gamma [Geobacter sp. DSM 9736]
MITEKVPGFHEWLETPAGRVPRVSTELGFADRLGACKARWGIGRMSYMVPPGLYALGKPSAEDPVVVTANYKMSYDIVRSALAGRNIWLLVLETYGINVWCAAGKGSFGTEELVRRIKAAGLARVVAHRRLLLPILGAPGVAAHEVARQTGFSVQYATIRAADLPSFLDNGMATTPEMREMTFSLRERAVLVPVEVVLALKPTLLIMLCLFLLGTLLGGVVAGAKSAAAYFGAMLAGVAAGPILLPWLPGRSFSVKGAVVGVGWSAAWYLIGGGAEWSVLSTIAAFVALPAVSAFYTLNFTGCTPYTSRTGVKREMRAALPVMGLAIAAAGIMIVAAKFLS